MIETMKAIITDEHGGPEVLTLADVDLPTVGVDEVLIKVSAAGVNRPDIMQRRGFYYPPKGASQILGLEVAGEIIEPGENVSEWQPGDKVCALTNGGGYAEYVSVPRGQCLRIPTGLTMVQAASLPETYFTVWENLFFRGMLKAGQCCLVHGGSSGIGVAAIQMAKAFGAKVYATAGSDKKCQFCRDIGADAAINYYEEDFVERINKLEPTGINVILDMVGGEYVNKHLKIAAEEGRIVNIGVQGGAKVELDLWTLIAKRLTLTGSTLRAQSRDRKAVIASELEKIIWPMLESGLVRPIVDSVYPLEKAKDAHILMESSAHIGKIILQVYDSE